MSLVMSFVIWTVAGGLAGWLAGRSEQHPAAVRLYVMVGIAGAILGGFLWLPAFFEAQPGSTYVFFFDFLTFNLFAALFGSTAGFWVVHIMDLVRDRRSNISSQN